MQHGYKLLGSAQNDTVKRLARLIQNGRDRRKEGVMVLEGIHLCESGLACGWVYEQVFVNQHALAHPEVMTLLDRLPASTPVFVLEEGLFARVSALSSAPEMLSVCLRPAACESALTTACIMLEDIQDPGNMGTILRSAAASGVNVVYLSPGCVDVYSPKVLRSGMGAHFALEIHEHADLPALLRAFPGVKLVTSLEGDRSLYAQDLSGQVAFVFGNEGAGVSAELHAIADARVRIPMPGKAESLNVAMAATLCLFERVRQLE